MYKRQVNEQVTTVITATEPVRVVDISTDKVAGDQPIENIIRLKPKETGHEDGEVLEMCIRDRVNVVHLLLFRHEVGMAEVIAFGQLVLVGRLCPAG